MVVLALHAVLATREALQESRGIWPGAKRLRSLDSRRRKEARNRYRCAMRRTLHQAGLLTLANLADLRRRPGPALALAVSIACATGVFLATMALASGIERALASTARPDRAIVTSSVADAEATSLLQAHQVAAVRDMGFAAASPEYVLTLPKVARKRDGALFSLGKRGVEPAAFELRPEVRIVAGRAFELGKWEMIVGVRAAREFAGLAIGDVVRHRDAPNVDWHIVGHFTAGGGMHESELWVDKTALAAYGWAGNAAKVVWVRLDDPASLPAMDRTLRTSPMLAATRLVAEREFFQTFGERVTRPLRTFAAVVGTIMVLGAVSAAVYAAATATAARRLELATLRALGIGTFPIGAAIVAESALVAAGGGLLGTAIVHAAIDGAGGVDTLGRFDVQLAYDKAVTTEAALIALACAVAVGIIGTVGAVVHAARLDIASTLRRMGP